MEACHVVTGLWRRKRVGIGDKIAIDGSHPVPVSTGCYTDHSHIQARHV